MKLLFIQLLMKPIYNLLIIFLSTFKWNLGLAIVLLTLIVRLCMIKITSANQQMTHWMNELQPKLDEIQKKYADNPNKMAEETMKAFKKEWKWPLKWCLWALIQFPIFLWLYWTVRKMTEWTIPEDWLYSFFYSFWEKFASIQAVDNWSIQSTFLWINLFERWNWILTIIVSVFTLLQMKLTNLVRPQPKTPQKWPNWEILPDMSKMMWSMWWIMAFMMWSVVFGIQSAIWLYLLVTTLFSIIQYTIQYRKYLEAERLKIRNKPEIIGK